MTRKLLLSASLLGMLYAICACAAEAQPSARGAALQNSGTGADVDRDVDERVDEDRDDDIDEANDNDNEFDVQFADLPQAVRTTAGAEVGAGDVVGVERDREETGLVYEIEFVRDGVEYEVDITEDGTKLGTERD